MLLLASETLRRAVFKWRGHLPVPLALLGFGLLVWCGPGFPPAWRGRVLVMAVSAIFVGHLLRFWALGHIGATTRSVRLQAPFLATTGPYGHVRNPLYLANGLIAVGYALALAQPILLPLTLLLLLVQYGIIVPWEERYLAATFGTEFDRYAQAVGRIWPCFRRYSGPSRNFDRSVLVSKEWLALALSVAILTLARLSIWAHERWFIAS